MTQIHKNSTIFVFGSNLRGRHGKGAALVAYHSFGAREGVYLGRTGNAYAIPTKDQYLKPLDLHIISLAVIEFLEYAKANPDLNFIVTRIGCGYAEKTDAEIAPMFKGAPENCQLPGSWRERLAALDQA